MKTYVNYLAAAAVAVAGLGFGAGSYAQSAADQAQNAGQQAGQSMNQAGQNMGQAAQNAGQAAVSGAESALYSAANITQQADPSELQQIQSQLGKVINDSVSENGFSNLPNYFSQKDQQRLQNAQPGEEQNELNQQVKQFNQAWQQKYNSKFNLSNPQQTLSSLTVKTDSQKQHALVQLSGFRHGQMGQMNEEHEAQAGQTGAQATGQTGASGETAQANGGEAMSNAQGEQGQGMQGQGMHGQGGMAMMGRHELRMTNENGNWVLDLPNNVTNEQIERSLTQSLSRINQNQSQWPSDQSRAEQIVSYHVLQAYAKLGQGATNPEASNR